MSDGAYTYYIAYKLFAKAHFNEKLLHEMLSEPDIWFILSTIDLII